MRWREDSYGGKRRVVKGIKEENAQQYKPAWYKINMSKQILNNGQAPLSQVLLKMNI
jgi:hypothetical protein